MIPVTTCGGRRMAVFGLARSGLTAAEALLAGGADVLVWDDGEEARARATGMGLVLADLAEADWSAIDGLVLAPGVPLTHPEPHWTVRMAKAAGVPVIGDTELFMQEYRASASRARVVGITGTNGKSTASALTAHLLSEAGWTVSLGGNIGAAILGLAPFQDGRAYVIEFSSYQIDLTPTLTLDAAALLNITPDHLDRHGTMANYAAVKERIFSGMRPGASAVIGVDDEYCRAVAGRLSPDLDVRRISVERPLDDGVYGTDGAIHDMRSGEELATVSLAGVDTLRGTHNLQNAATAWALARGVGADETALRQGFATFAGLEHRMEVVARDDGLLFINDSKATNAEAAARALAAFDNIFWIAGGLAKEGGIDDLVPLLPRVAKAYLIGAAADAFAARLEGRVPFELAGTLDRAVAAARADAARSLEWAGHGREAVVLLSPACASFDQFASFEVRGDAFKAEVARARREQAG